jgi:hypothetical protein
MQCNAAVGVKSFFDMMHSGPHKLMLFGAACTHVTDPIAKASKHWHLTQVNIIIDELDGPAVSALQRAIAEVKQRWSVMR